MHAVLLFSGCRLALAPSRLDILFDAVVFLLFPPRGVPGQIRKTAKCNAKARRRSVRAWNNRGEVRGFRLQLRPSTTPGADGHSCKGEMQLVNETFLAEYNVQNKQNKAEMCLL